MLSDFMNRGFEDAIKIANKKHDFIAVRVFDEREADLPDVGLIFARDAETNEHRWIDSSDRKVRRQYNNWYQAHTDYLQDTFRRSGVDVAKIATDHDYIRPLMNLFNKRGARR
jgi:hypothetical protein